MAGDYTFGGYSLKSIYQPSYSSYTGNNISRAPSAGIETPIKASVMGMTTDPRTANQLQALSTTLNQGASTVEICGPLGTNEFDEIPRQHFEEMRRKAKLSGAQISLHAPIVEPTGRTQNGYDEGFRVQTENQLKGVIEKAIFMDDKGGMPIVVHAAAGEGSTWKYVENKETGQREKKYDMMVAVDRLSGRVVPVTEDTKYYPHSEIKDGKIKESFHSVERQLESINASQWDDELKKIEMQRENAVRIIESVHPSVINAISSGERLESPEAHAAYQKFGFANEYLEEANRQANASFNRAYEIALKENNQDMINELNKISENYKKNLGIGDEKSNLGRNPYAITEAVGQLVHELKGLTPKQFVPLEEFAIETGSKTFAGVAMHAYEKTKEWNKEHKENKKAPTIAIENLYQGMGFSQAKDLKLLVEESQKKFAEELAKKEGLKQKEAEKIASEMLGVTLDVGHLNISRKHGFTSEDLANEARELAKHVKHLHITDNFGYSDSHLPIGMGNVPIALIEKAISDVQGTDEASKIRRINEVGGWFKNFQSSPFPLLLESVGSPIYSSGSGPYWQQAGGFQQSYIEGYGMMLPQTHYQMFGAGFSNLPRELGGASGQSGGRMGGGF